MRGQGKHVTEKVVVGVRWLLSRNKPTDDLGSFRTMWVTWRGSLDKRNATTNSRRKKSWSEGSIYKNYWNIKLLWC